MRWFESGSGRFYRGGCWRRDLSYVQVTCRFLDVPGYVRRTISLRLARRAP